MRKLVLLVAFIAVSSNIFAQLDQFYGPLGLKFGCQRDSVKEFMATKFSSATLNQDLSMGMEYLGGSWAGLYSVNSWVWQFTEEGEMHTLRLKINVGEDFEVWDKYDEIADLVAEKYGKPFRVVQEWKAPFSLSDKDAMGLIALKDGKVAYRKLWVRYNDPDNKEDQNSIEVEMTMDAKVYVTYRNHDLLEKALKELRIKMKAKM